jgi:predicted ATP-binding protein involved in virulence
VIYLKIITYIKQFLYIEWNKTLSSGEEVFLNQFINLYYYLNDYIEKKTKFHISKDSSIILCIDEGELTLHPNWQKKYINYLLYFIKNNTENPNFHLICTSHSPFILSDLPKENIIFLDKYKKEDEEVKSGIQKIGNCKNISDKIDIVQTFGANIHTLLSHGFFMENGLMSEFAKEKIEAIKKFYELVKKCEKVIKESAKVKLTVQNIYLGYEKDFKHIQSIIGEPFLKTIMKNYLDELDILFYGKNKFLDNEIKRLQSLKDD